MDPQQPIRLQLNAILENLTAMVKQSTAQPHFLVLPPARRWKSGMRHAEG
jgi:hypothetical protein